MTAEEIAARMLAELYHGPQHIEVSKAFYEAFAEIADPWKRELSRARRQLARIGA
jgi:hypothetical protein